MSLPASFGRCLRLPAAAGLLALAACTGASADEGAADRLLADEAQTVYSLGRTNGTDTETFQHVSGLAFDADDNLYVLDGGRGRVLVFGPDGAFVRQIGKKGQGPGELAAPLQVAVTREGLVVVSDLGRRGFAVFGRDGTYLRNIPFQDGRGVAGLELRAHPQAGFVTAYQPVPGRDPDTKGVEIVHIPVDGSGAPATLFTVPPGSGSAGMIDPRLPAFTPRVHWGVLPDGGVAAAHTARYEVAVAGPDGKQSRTLGRPIEPRRVTTADREGERAKRMESLEHEGSKLSPESHRAVLAMIDELRFADVMPVIDGFLVDPAGYVWVKRTGAGGEEPGPIDLFAPDGTYAGSVQGLTMPQAVSASGRAASLERDDDYVERVVVRQISPSWRAPATP